MKMTINAEKGLCLCRSHHYPPTPPDTAGRTRGVGAHIDFAAMTLLLQDAGMKLSPSVINDRTTAR